MGNIENNTLSSFCNLEKPFENTRDSRYFYESKIHGEALSRMKFLVQDRNMGMGLLTGEIGCGKSLTRTVFHNSLSPASYKVICIENSLLDFDGLLLEIVSQLRNTRSMLPEFPDRYSRLAEFKKLLFEEVHKTGRHLVLLLDEAQMLSVESLDFIKSLTNISSERINFLSVILIGQPELRTHLKQLPQVDQRISLRYHLSPLSPDEVTRYLLFRLHMSGYKGTPPITQQAVEIIARTSRGIPREINRICKLALDHAIAQKLPILDSGVIRLVVTDLLRHGGSISADGSGILAS